MQRSLGFASPMSLSEDYGSASNVVHMRPGGGMVTPQAQAPVPNPAPVEEDGDYGGWAKKLVNKQYRHDFDYARGHGASREEAYAYADAEEAKRKAADVQQESMHGQQSAWETVIQAATEEKQSGGRQLGPKGSDTYTYWQNPDNSIVVLTNTATNQPINQYYSAGSQAAKNVLASYGPHPSAMQQQQEPSAWEKAQGFFQASGQALAAAQKPAEKPDNTLLYVGLAGAGVVGLGLLALALRR